ncbi:MAG: CRISPR-associated endonuclease Cas2 [Thermoanaerobaculia bacterium]
MKWVVAYDISDDALRMRVAERLGTIGWRVQESVFECTFEHEPARPAALVAPPCGHVTDAFNRRGFGRRSAPDVSLDS